MLSRDRATGRPTRTGAGRLWRATGAGGHFPGRRFPRGFMGDSLAGTWNRVDQMQIFPTAPPRPTRCVTKCKGFVQLHSLRTVPRLSCTLLTHFPYYHKCANKGSATAPANCNHHGHHDEAPHKEELEVRRAGFCMLSKARWEALQTEYIRYHAPLPPSFPLPYL